MLEGPRRATFEGTLSEDGTIAGTFEQAGVAGTFELTRAEAQVEEKEPLPYIEEEVTLQRRRRILPQRARRTWVKVTGTY